MTSPTGERAVAPPTSLGDVVADVVHHVAEVVGVFDQSGVLWWCNAAVERVLGWQPEEMIGRHGAGLLHPDDVPLALELMVSAQATGGGVKEPVVYRLAHRDGRWIDLEIISSNVALPDGELVLVLTGRPAGAARPSAAIVDEVSTRVSAMFDRAHIGLAQVALDGSVLRANDELARMVGAPGGTALLGATFLSLFDDVLLDLLAGDGGQHPQVRTTSGRHAHLSSALVLDHRGEPMYYAVQASDITDLVLAQEQLANNDRRLSTLIETADEGILVADSFGRVLYGNGRLVAMLDPDGPITGRLVGDVLPGIDVRSAALGDGFRLETQVRRRDGARLWAIVAASPFQWSATDAPGALVMVTDVTELKAAQEELVHRSTHDALTGLANRTLLDAWGALEATATDAVLYVDLDGFKAVNDTHGHGVGDELLVVVAQRLHAAVRRSDLIGRVGGDEFVVLCPAISRDAAEDLANRIIRSLRQPIATARVTVTVGASVGIALGRSDVTYEQLIDRADAALYAAKRAGGGLVAVDGPPRTAPREG
ncbi:MAG TPA: diguanylate cyclase [Acidimicrobiales bacterium]|nr:diguanylate cyclase [Acidimicrobiales bacterium]